jgi:hypothetical protein
MTDLIKRLEALEAPCRECDFAIHRAIHNLPEDWPECTGNNHWMSFRYTASLDTAMTLVPQGDFDQDWSRSTRYKSEGFKLWQVRIALETVEQDPQELGPVALGEHDTPAIALCIAALRAQEASHDRS